MTDTQWHEIEISSGYFEKATINGKHINSDLVYDLAAPHGDIYRGWRINVKEEHYHGSGGMDESSSTVLIICKPWDKPSPRMLIEAGWKAMVNIELSGVQIEKEALLAQKNAINSVKADIERLKIHLAAIERRPLEDYISPASKRYKGVSFDV